MKGLFIEMNGLKIWVDDVRPAPDGWVWLKSVNDTIAFIKKCEKDLQFFTNKATNCIHNGEISEYKKLMEVASRRCIEIISLDHDAGDYAKDGGDYIKILDWCEEWLRDKPYSYTFNIHSMNPVGVQNMMNIIKKNNWSYLYLD